MVLVREQDVSDWTGREWIGGSGRDSVGSASLPLRTNSTPVQSRGSSGTGAT